MKLDAFIFEHTSYAIKTISFKYQYGINPSQGIPSTIYFFMKHVCPGKLCHSEYDEEYD